jgi:hypothetical protein
MRTYLIDFNIYSEGCQLFPGTAKSEGTKRLCIILPSVAGPRGF